jgi:transcriptional regulator with XRE-family HTH domain
MTGAQLAAKAGICPSVLSTIERGTRTASPRSLTALAGALGCKPEDLMPPERPRRREA